MVFLFLPTSFLVAATPAPAEPARLQATARFLAGLPTPSYPGMEGFVRDPGWVDHALAMDRAWATLERERLAPMQAWSRRELKTLRDVGTVLYPFGGPDNLHVQVLHRPSFTRFREVLLQGSSSILQDDSGVPQRFLDPKRWNVQLYGRYEAPIALFREFAQADLAARYHDKDVQPLDFGLGYQHRGHSSNLALVRFQAAAVGPGR